MKHSYGMPSQRTMTTAESLWPKVCQGRLIIIHIAPQDPNHTGLPVSARACASVLNFLHHAADEVHMRLW